MVEMEAANRLASYTTNELDNDKYRPADDRYRCPYIFPPESSYLQSE